MNPEATPQAPAAPADPFATFGQAPTPAPAPEPQPFVPPTGDPNPVEPAPQPTEPAPQPTAPTEPAAPATPAAPAEPVQPAAPQQESYEEYMARVLADIPQAAEPPKLETVNQEDPAAVEQFFADLVASAVQQAEANVEKKYAVREAETRGWNEAFDAYPSLRQNHALRETIHNIRMGSFSRGIAMTPKQAAEHLLATSHADYQRGIADNQVHTKIENVQPTNGSSVEVPQVTTTDDQLRAIQTGGEAALAAILDAEVKAGRL